MSSLKEVHNIIYYVGGGYKDVDSFEELMLNIQWRYCTGKKWDEENWVKAHKGYEPKFGSSLSVKRSY